VEGTYTAFATLNRPDYGHLSRRKSVYLSDGMAAVGLPDARRDPDVAGGLPDAHRKASAAGDLLGGQGGQGLGRAQEGVTVARLE
jgi:hypothetical protein